MASTLHHGGGGVGEVLIFSVVFSPPQHANEDVERMLLGNKCDMEDKRVVPKAKGEQVRTPNKCARPPPPRWEHFGHTPSGPF